MYENQHRILDEVIENRQGRAIGKADLEAYFRPGKFSGAHFERFQRERNEGDDRDRLTADDLMAVKFLSVDVPRDACVRWLFDDAEFIYELLRQIPSDPIWEHDYDEQRKPWKPANQLWKLFCEPHGVNWVTAGKLLARKRPNLIPVYDRVVRAGLGAPTGFWQCMSSYLRGHDDRIRAWEQLRADAGVGSDISVLRTIDVALWMRGEPT